MSATPIFDEVLRARTCRLARPARDGEDPRVERTAGPATEDPTRPSLYLVTRDGTGRHARGRDAPVHYAGDSSPA